MKHIVVTESGDLICAMLPQWQSRGLGLKVKQVHGNTLCCQLQHMGQIEIGEPVHKDQSVGDETCFLTRIFCSCTLRVRVSGHIVELWKA